MQQQKSTTQQISSADTSTVPVYDTQPWTTQLDLDNTVNHLYEPDLYSTSVNTPITNNNSIGGIQSTYPFGDMTTNYVSDTSSNPNNDSEYSYAPPPYHHHPRHFHPHHPHTLYQHHHGSNYDISLNNGYYQQQPALNNHQILSMDTYQTNDGLTYSMQQQQIDANDEQHIYLRAHSASSHSSSSSVSSPILTTNNNLPSSSSSAASSSNYSYPHKNSSLLTNGYFHPNSNGILTLYGHHHQHHSDIESLLHLNDINEDNNDDNDDDDDDDFSTLVHHHDEMIDDHQHLFSLFHSDNPQLVSHNEPSTSVLRTVLKKPVVGEN